MFFQNFFQGACGRKFFYCVRYGYVYGSQVRTRIHRVYLPHLRQSTEVSPPGKSHWKDIQDCVLLSRLWVCGKMVAGTLFISGALHT